MAELKITDIIKQEEGSKYVHMDINIFSQLNDLQGNKKIKNYKHKIFCYSYLWLCSYLWKYSKYGEIKILPHEIRSILGYAKGNKTIDYITKLNGVLDKEGFTETSRDFPIHTEIGDNGVIVSHLSDEDPETRKMFLMFHGNRYCYKKPLHQIERIEKGYVKMGLAYSREDALRVTVEEFNRILEDDNCGLTEFYVYGYLKMRSKMRGFNPVKIYLQEIANEVGCSKKTISLAIKRLGDIEMIKKSTIVKSEDGKISEDSRYSIPDRFGKLTKLKYASVSSQ